MTKEEFEELLDATEYDYWLSCEQPNQTKYPLYHDQVIAAFEAQQAEITRLREALQKVVNEFDPWDPSTAVTAMSENMAEIAKEALEGK